MNIDFTDLKTYWEDVHQEIQDLNEVVEQLLSKTRSADDIYSQALIKLSSKIDTLDLKLTCIELVYTHTIKDVLSDNIHYYYLDDDRIFKLNLKRNSLGIIHKAII